ncbi:DDE_3 domain-containing protein [Trichonephila clavipes]|nr:DDE_3 domain-containing protein [Trichonephila clavipes]
MPARHYVSDYDRGRSIGRLKAVQSVATVAAAMRVSKTLVAKRNRNFTPGQIPAKLATANSTHLSARTISRRLNQVGLYKRNCSLHPTSTTSSSREITLVCATDPNFLFMDDNVSPQSSVEKQDTLKSKNILHIQWPTYSPDLNSIEHAWDALERRVAQRTIPPRTVQELKTALKEKWDNIPQGIFVLI